MHISLVAGVGVFGVVSILPAGEMGELTIRETLPLNAGEVASLRQILSEHPEAAALLVEKQQEIQSQELRPPAP